MDLDQDFELKLCGFAAQREGFLDYVVPFNLPRESVLFQSCRISSSGNPVACVMTSKETPSFLKLAAVLILSSWVPFSWIRMVAATGFPVVQKIHI